MAGPDQMKAWRPRGLGIACLPPEPAVFTERTTMTTKRTQPESATIRPVPAPTSAKKEPSRMMGLLIVDVLAARKASPPARKAAIAKKAKG